MATLRASWRARCRWHLRRHRCVKVIDGLDSIGFDFYNGPGGWHTATMHGTITGSHRACAWCGKRMEKK